MKAHEMYSNEYRDFHDIVNGNFDWSGVYPITYNDGSQNNCPYGAKECDSLIAPFGKYPESCPRFGGVIDTSKKVKIAKILCKGKKWYETTGEAEPTTAGTYFKK
jgi:hypothetical protein